MNVRIRQTAALLGAAAMLTLGVDAATYAATGDSLIVGKMNVSTKTTKIKTTGNGPALSVISKPTAPPFAVSNGNLVAKLNADAVDGKSAADLEPATVVYTVNGTSNTIQDGARYPLQVAPGAYQVSWMMNGFKSDAEPVYCWVAPHSELDAFNYANMASASGTGYYAGLSGSGMITVPAANDLVFECEQDSISLAAPVRVTLQKVVGSAPGAVAPKLAGRGKAVTAD